MTAARCLSFSSPKDPGENEALPWLGEVHEVPLPVVPSPRVSRSLSAALAVCDGQQQQHAISSFLDSRERTAAPFGVSPGRHLEPLPSPSAARSQSVCKPLSAQGGPCAKRGYAVLMQTMPISPPYGHRS